MNELATIKPAANLSGALVRACEERGIGLEDVDDELLAAVSPLLAPDVSPLFVP